MTSVLVLDDDALVTRALTRSLATVGVEVLGASSLDEALEVATSHHPRLALVDVSVVKSDIGGAVDALHGARSDLEVILMSGGARPAAAAPGLRFVRKPFGVASVRDALEDARRAQTA